MTVVRVADETTGVLTHLGLLAELIADGAAAIKPYDEDIGGVGDFKPGVGQVVLDSAKLAPFRVVLVVGLRAFWHVHSTVFRVLAVKCAFLDGGRCILFDVNVVFAEVVNVFENTVDGYDDVD